MSTYCMRGVSDETVCTFPNLLLTKPPPCEAGHEPDEPRLLDGKSTTYLKKHFDLRKQKSKLSARALYLSRLVIFSLRYYV